MLLRDGMLVMLKLGGPPLLVALVVGLLIALLQAVTQINEATLAFVPKVLALCAGAGAARAVHAVDAVGLHPHAVRSAGRHRRLMTGDDAALLAALPAWAFAFVLVMARVGAAMTLLPGLGEAEPPAMVRAGPRRSASRRCCCQASRRSIPPVPEAGAQAALMVAAEVVTGLWLGLAGAAAGAGAADRRAVHRLHARRRQRAAARSGTRRPGDADRPAVRDRGAGSPSWSPACTRCRWPRWPAAIG